MTRIIVFLAGLAILIGSNICIWRMGYKAGLKYTIDVGSLFSLLELVLLPCLVFMLVRIARDWGRKPVGGMILLFFVFLLPQLFFDYEQAYVFGSARVRAFYSSDLSRLRDTELAVEQYRDLHSVYPASLEQLVPALMPAVPVSRYGKNMQLHCALAKDANSTRTKYLVWSPGPNERYEIEACPQLTDAISKLAEGDIPEWLCARVYDPTNGTHSIGDVIRFKRW
ncbi:hypothetical protein LLG95_06835 [bacterium]|nr:hypothetical protein [bacterium]